MVLFEAFEKCRISFIYMLNYDILNVIVLM